MTIVCKRVFFVAVKKNGRIININPDWKKKVTSAVREITVSWLKEGPTKGPLNMRVLRVVSEHGPQPGSHDA